MFVQYEILLIFKDNLFYQLEKVLNPPVTSNNLVISTPILKSYIQFMDYHSIRDVFGAYLHFSSVVMASANQIASHCLE